MYSVITTATRDEIERAVGSTGLGNRKFHAQTRPAPGERGAIIVSVPEWAAMSLRSALQRIEAWFDRAQPPARPHGRPIVSHAAASQIRKYDKVTRKDRKIRREMKVA